LVVRKIAFLFFGQRGWPRIPVKFVPENIFDPEAVEKFFGSICLDLRG
jgi:hypothetical protein